MKTWIKSTLHYQVVGGLHFWRVGRLGGSVYLRKLPERVSADQKITPGTPQPPRVYFDPVVTWTI